MSLPWSAPSPVAPSTPGYAMHVPRRRRSRLRTVLGTLLVGGVLLGGFIWFGSGTEDPSRFGDLHVGLCLTSVPSGRVTAVDEVDCGEPHTVEIFGQGTFDELDSTSADEQAAARCIDGVSETERGQLVAVDAAISYIGQNRKAGRFFCIAEFESRTGPLADAAN